MKLTTVSDDYYITPNAILIGAINLGNKSSIWWNAVIRADNEPITLGDNTNIQDSCVPVSYTHLTLPTSDLV